jgi:AhpD family alkylhydroperoxidase
MQNVEWEACFIEPLHDAELEQYVRGELGTLTASTRFYAHVPWMARAQSQLNWLAGKLAHISAPLSEKIALVVTQDNSCRYCFSSMRLFLRMMGLPEDHIRRLEEDALSADLDPRELAAMRFARRLSRSNPLVTPENLEPLQAAGYAIEAIKEIALVATLMGSINRATTFAALPPSDYDRIPKARIFRPVLRFLSRKSMAKWRQGAPDFFAQELPKDAPFAFLFAALDGLPLGRAVWTMSDEAWRSDILPRRSKALIFAVVARALGCEASEREAARLVAAEGMTGVELKQVLTHLGSPQLDPIEAQIVPFARETVWYTPAPIQRRLRALQEHLSTPQVLELAGITGMANMVCRMCVVVKAC